MADAVTATIYLLLICGHQIAHTEWAPYDAEAHWHPGDARWCRECGGHGTVKVVIDPAYNPLPA